MRYQDTALSPKERAKDLLARLTLTEKVGQVCQKLYGFSSYTRTGDEIVLSDSFKQEVENCKGLGTLYGLYRADPWSGRDHDTGLWGMHAVRAYNTVQRYVLEHSRFGIPVLMSSECPHGHQAPDGYLLPVNLASGATWSPELLEEAYTVCAEQMGQLGVHLSLMSMLDICRDPRWGRSEECYSEDPRLASAFAAAATRGCRKAGVRTVSKHFCAQGETTGGRNASAARIGARELHEIHLPAAKAAVDAGTDGFMAAYNEIDGVPCHANRKLLTDTLRGEMGFDGIIMADGVAIDRLDMVTGDTAASGALAMNSGVDVGLWDEAFSHLEEAAERGLVDMERLDAAVEKVLELKFALGLFEHPYLDETEPSTFNYDEYPQSLELARQSPVLLKNEGILPIMDAGKKLAVIGPNADDLYCLLGDYTPPQREGTTLLTAMRSILPNPIVYAAGCTVCGTDKSGIDAAVELAEKSDITVLVLGGSSSRFAGARFDSNGAVIADGPVQMDCGEGVDVTSLDLPGVQTELFERVTAAAKQVITIVIGGRAYATAALRDRSDALLYAFYPGPMGGRAIAEILSGQIAPSGRLPVTLPRSADVLPCVYNQKLGHMSAPDAVTYPFGFGLTYTTFEVTDVSLPEGDISESEIDGGEIHVSCTVTNTGMRDGYALIQLFTQHRVPMVMPREKELRAFRKVFLPAGASERVTLTLGREVLSAWDIDLCPTVKGQFTLYLEESARPIAETRFGIH